MLPKMMAMVIEGGCAELSDIDWQPSGFGMGRCGWSRNADNRNHYGKQP
jgi:hypothetical protein